NVERPIWVPWTGWKPILRSHPMRLLFASLLFALSLAASATSTAQVRVTPEKSKGGTKWEPLWTGVPETFPRDLGAPDWKVPTDLTKWEKTGREEIRKILLQGLGDMPARPDPAKVKVLSKEEKDGYTLEKFEFFNGADMVVPGILAIPKNRKGPVPV